MFNSKAVNYFFLFCALLVAIGELHRSFSQGNESSVVTNEGIENKQQLDDATVPEKIPSRINKVRRSKEMIFPVRGKSQKNLIGLFGEPRGGGARKHQGIDIAAERGTPVVAVMDGEVVKVKEGGNGGKQVWMKAANGEFTFFYAHLHTQSVKPGQTVEQGDELGTVGTTGNAPENAPHLHFEILTEGRRAVDPLVMLP